MRKVLSGVQKAEGFTVLFSGDSHFIASSHFTYPSLRSLRFLLQLSPQPVLIRIRFPAALGL